MVGRFLILLVNKHMLIYCEHWIISPIVQDYEKKNIHMPLTDYKPLPSRSLYEGLIYYLILGSKVAVFTPL